MKRVHPQGAALREKWNMFYSQCRARRVLFTRTYALIHIRSEFCHSIVLNLCFLQSALKVRLFHSLHGCVQDKNLFSVFSGILSRLSSNCVRTLME